MKIPKSVLSWLLEGDPAIQWQTLRNLTTDSDPKSVEAKRSKIAEKGWGARTFSQG